MPERLVVIGGDAAGMTAASQARRRKGPADLEIVAFERGGYTSYSACGIPYYLGRAFDGFERLVVRGPEEFRADHAIDARIRHEVLEIDLAGRRVLVRDLEGATERHEPFDHLMIGTGAVPRRPPLPEVDSGGIFGVQTLDDALAVERALEDRPTAAVVVGAGYIGLEMAEAFRARGLDVTVVEAGPAPMNSLDPDMGALVADAMRAIDIDLRLEEPVEGFEARGGQVAAVVTSEGSIPADIVLLALGVRPDVELAERAGIQIGSSGAIAVDDRLRTSAGGVWAAGDCADKLHRVSGRRVAFPLGTHANKEGRIAGIDIAGGDERFPGIVGTAISRVCDLEVARTGLAAAEARAAGFDAVGVAVDSTTRAGYFPGSGSIRTKLIADRGSGRLLGGQIVGEEGSAKRVDVLATTLWNEMTVDDIVNVDLSYAPPFSPLWDPVLIAARKTTEALAAGSDEHR